MPVHCRDASILIGPSAFLRFVIDASYPRGWADTGPLLIGADKLEKPPAPIAGFEQGFVREFRLVPAWRLRDPSGGARAHVPRCKSHSASSSWI